MADGGIALIAFGIFTIYIMVFLPPPRTHYQWDPWG